MREQEAIKILNPDADVVWKAYDGKDMERCNEACRVACVALEKYQKECFEAKAALKTVEENYSNMVDSWRQKATECDILWKVIEVLANG